MNTEVVQVPESVNKCLCYTDAVVEKVIRIDHIVAGIMKDDHFNKAVIGTIEARGTGIFVCAKCGDYQYELNYERTAHKIVPMSASCTCQRAYQLFMEIMSAEAYADWLTLINDPMGLMCDNSERTEAAWAQENVTLKVPTKEQIDAWLEKHCLKYVYDMVIDNRETCSCRVRANSDE